MKWILFVLFLGVCGCARDITGSGVGVQGGYICNLQNDYIELQRLSFNVPSVFLNKPCSDFVDYSNHKPGDWFSVGGGLQRMTTPSVYADVFSLGFNVIGGLSKVGLEHRLAPEDFVEFKWDQSADKVGPTLKRVTWVERVGKTCARLDYVTGNQMMHRRIVEYWCWDEVSSLGVPFLIWASEVVAPGEPWKVDLEETIFEPAFSSLKFNVISGEYRRALLEDKARRCGRHIKSYTERGVGWLTGATVESKWTPVFLEMCGYDVAAMTKSSKAPAASPLGAAAGSSLERKYD